MNKYADLLQLIKENPNLPVIPIVNSEVVGDEYGTWIASFGSAYVGEYTLYKDRYYDDRDDFKEAYYDYNSEALNIRFDYDPLRKKKNEEALEKYLEEVAENCFIKAILVNINTPDV